MLRRREYAQEPQGLRYLIRNEELISERKGMPGLEGEKRQICREAGCQICSLIVLRSPEAKLTKASGSYFCRLTVTGKVTGSYYYGKWACCCGYT